MKKVTVVVLVRMPVLVMDETMTEQQLKQCAVAKMASDGYTDAEAVSVEPWKHATILETWHPNFPSLIN